MSEQSETPVEKYIGAAIENLGRGLMHLNVAVSSDWSSARQSAVSLARGAFAKADDLLRDAERALERKACPDCGEPERNGVPIHKIECPRATPGGTT